MQEEIVNIVNKLECGEIIKLGDVTIFHADECLKITGWSNYINFGNITKCSALQELEEIKTIFDNIKIASEEFEKFAKNKQIQFELLYNDSGKCAISICVEENQNITWGIGN